jgi:anti-sigma regulatory factor (Ser/Thr protein kinase)
VGEVVELEIPARPEFLALARLLVAAAVAGDPVFPEDRLDDLRLAVSEACTNAMEAQARAARTRAGTNGHSPAS